MKRNQKKPNAVKNLINFSNIALLVSLIIAGVSLCISVISLKTAQESTALQYNVIPTVIDTEEGIVYFDIEMVVTNGAIGDVRAFDYRDGRVKEIANNVGGTINKYSNKKQRTFGFQLDYSYEGEGYATSYIWVHGKDGSESLGLILCHIDILHGNTQAKFYSQEDLILAEMDETESIYGDALRNYRTMLEILKENGEL